jgi:hypothetical protein
MPCGIGTWFLGSTIPSLAQQRRPKIAKNQVSKLGRRYLAALGKVIVKVVP